MIARRREINLIDRQMFVFVALATRVDKFSRILAKVATDDGEGPPLGLGLCSLLPPLLRLILILQECVVVFALWDVLWGVALLGELVVDEAELAALLTGRDSVQADVELGTVVGVRVLGVRVELSKLISGSLLGAGEAVVGLVCISLALLPVGHLGPVADSAVLVEPQSGAAGVLLRGPVHAGVEDVAHAGVGVRVEPVQTGAQVALLPV